MFADVLKPEAFVEPQALGELAQQAGVRLWRPEDSELVRPRQVELPVLVYGPEDFVLLAEVQSDVQRQGLPWLQESPASALALGQHGEEWRERLGGLVAQLVAVVGGRGLLTCRFLLDADDRCWLTAVLVGLTDTQPLTELVMGMDLAATQEHIAAGERPTDDHPPPQPIGYAVSACVVAEGATSIHSKSLPGAAGPSGAVSTESVSSGSVPTGSVQVEAVRVPAAIPGRLRVDTRVQAGEVRDASTSALLLRLTAMAPIRHRAVLLLDRMLSAVAVPPLSTNAALLRDMLSDETFRAGQYDQTLLGRLSTTSLRAC